MLQYHIKVNMTSEGKHWLKASQGGCRRCYENTWWNEVFEWEETNENFSV